jgi:hypothetical protein
VSEQNDLGQIPANQIIHNRLGTLSMVDLFIDSFLSFDT